MLLKSAFIPLDGKVWYRRYIPIQKVWLIPWIRYTINPCDCKIPKISLSLVNSFLYTQAKSLWKVLKNNAK